jgi:hypothetical protein
MLTNPFNRHPYLASLDDWSIRKGDMSLVFSLGAYEFDPVLSSLSSWFGKDNSVVVSSPPSVGS